ncbi:DUF2207 domain-containing protein [Branchiibius sp. NY16-3462-2]|uniref:DUF2207 domain-containing protein n=1 Tax=Branchiibius sp. NY16-3462-2 TaxID=1807500 RepID=UPI0007958CFF|nr:DUF2207 domain-containing protein [Branchiibius sp. NY16-3462-2]KYH43156.1 hypothetical protein AZH51_17835 [Branchiibius sp. NY16-3462-2]
MRGVRILAVIGMLAALVFGPASMASAATGERIISWVSTYDVKADGTARVTEQLTWQFAPGQDAHGIKRWIITRQGYEPQPDKYRSYDLDDVSVSSSTGAPTEVQRTESGANTVLRIGDPNTTVSGTQKYTISYTLHGVVNKQDNGTTEFYWNVTGAQVSVPINSVRVTVAGPAASTKAACYYGAAKSTNQCQASAGGDATFSASNLAAYQEVSVVSAMPTSAFTNTDPILRDGSADQDDSSGLTPDQKAALAKVGLVGGIALPVLAAGGMGALFWKRGRDERYAGLTPGLTPTEGEGQVVRGGKQPIAVQFNPPAGVRAGLMGTLIDESADTVDVSATVVDLAARGYLTMREVEQRGMFAAGDWELTATRSEETEPLLQYEQVVLRGLFSRGSPIQLSQLKNHFASTLASAKSEMYAETIHRGWFRQNPAAVRSRWQMLGALLIGAAIASFVFLANLAMAAIGLPIGLVIAGLIVMFMGRRMASRTALGSAITQQSLGFKQYLETAEAGQIKFEEASQIFSKYLPYAVVFGIAERWSKVFGQVAEAAAAQGRPIIMPMWYIPINPGFSGFESIGSGVDAFGTVSAGTFVSTPGSSGGSGFGGGGFAGGGMGGGGASSW